MALVIVLEDGWDGHFALSTACRQAGHRVLAVQRPENLHTALRDLVADALVVDAGIPGVCMRRIGELAAAAEVPVVATGFSPWTPVGALAAFLPKPAPPAALIRALEELLAAGAHCAAA